MLATTSPETTRRQSPTGLSETSHWTTWSTPKQSPSSGVTDMKKALQERLKLLAGGDGGNIANGDTSPEESENDE